MSNLNKQYNYDDYYIYDDPIPYITELSKKYLNQLEKEFNNLPFNEENKLKFNELQQEFEKQILYIYPVKMKDYIRFYTCVNCIMLQKNKIPDPKIISMSYLDFLFYLIENDPNSVFYSMMLCDLINLCCRVESDNIKYIRDTNNKINLILDIKQEDGSIISLTINKKDFDCIKNIILYQNLPDYNDTYIDPKVEQALEEANEFINRHKKQVCSLEDQIICVLISTPFNIQQIKNLSIRKFIKILQRVDYKMHYEIYKTASMSGFVTFKEEIDHWMSEISNKNRFADTTVDYTDLKNNIQNVNK